MANELSPQQKLFEELKEDFGDVECWDARKLMPHVGYANWQDFENAIKRAMLSAKTSGEPVEKHFLGTSLKNNNAYGRGRPGTNYLLTRHACYLVFQNGDPKVAGIAAAQAYFVDQTIRQEAADKHAVDWERHYERLQNEGGEGQFTRIALERDVTSPELGIIRSDADRVFYNGFDTATMKRRLGIAPRRSLADFLPTRVLMAKTVATQMTIKDVKKNDLRGKRKIGRAHDSSHAFARQLITVNGTLPENSKAEADIKAVRIRLGLTKGPRNMIAEGQLPLL